MDIKYLRDNNLIILESISGSKAYGLDTPQSDTDIKGVFILPKKWYYGLNYIPQINNESNDVVFYELGRFMKLLAVNNPNILELLASPQDSIISRHPILTNIDPKKILSKLCKNTFGKFAISQIKKAKGLKKKIVNPVDKVRKSVLDFCFVSYRQGSIPLRKFLEINKLVQENCGLTNIPHMQNVYGLYSGENLGYKGIIQKEHSNDISLSSIPKGEMQIGLMYFNKNGYSTYCREYREYWNWVEKRNETRYQNTQSHGKNYDAKNMMHTFRLLEMAIEIGRERKINVRRPDRDFLLRVKSGQYTYDELLQLAKKKQAEMEETFERSALPESPDLDYINQMAYEIRNELYQEMI